MVQIQDVTPVNDDAARSGERLRLAGNAAYNAGDFEAAARSYRDSLEAAPLPSPSAPKALGNLAKALLMLGHPGEALANAERYVQACPPGTPDAAKARFRKGEALEAKGDLRAAREAYRDLVWLANMAHATWQPDLRSAPEICEMYVDAKHNFIVL